MIIDEYRTIKAQAESIFRDRGSKFLGLAVNIDNKEELVPILDRLRKEHPKSRHHCYAYKIGVDDNNYRINDDGEPSGSAGRPIYGQILSQELTHVAVIVTRYFGGTKLGVPGLINAYKTAAAQALEAAEKQTKYLYNHYTLRMEYGAMGPAMEHINNLGISISEKSYENDVLLTIGMRKSITEELLLRLKARLLQKSIEEVKTLKKIPGFTFTKIDDL